MSRSEDPIFDVLDPVRETHLESFFRELGAAQQRCDTIKTEVINRDENHVVIRDGVLNLPARTDFDCYANECHTFNNLTLNKKVEFEPVGFRIQDKLNVTILPCSWDEINICFDADDDSNRLVRLRLWFLEWFQPRRIDDAGQVLGVVHSLRGPKFVNDQWQVCLDMGSAPVEAFVELMHALASRGVVQMTVGSELDHVDADS